MDEQPEKSPAELAYQQAIAYGKDLARIYVQEKAKREELEVAYQMLDAVFKSSPDGLVVVDTVFNILHYNTAFQHSADYAHAEEKLNGRPLNSIFPSIELESALKRAAESDDTLLEVEFITPAPRKQAFLAKFWKLKTQRTQGWVIVLQNQSKMKRLEYQKSEFVNLAAHELHTPLISVIGFAELLVADKSLTPEIQKHYGEAILRGGQRLNKIVDELLLFADSAPAEMASGGVRDFSVTEVVEDVVANHRAYADERLIGIQASLPEKLPLLHGDPSALRSALYQLVLNGINFNQSGGFVRIDALATANVIEIRVTDTGIGIHAEDYETIFQPFYQVEVPMTRHVGGLGLGLAIARRAIRQLDGTLKVEKSDKTGTTFLASIPLKQAKPEPQVEGLHQELAAVQQQALAYARDVKVLYSRLQETNRALQEMNKRLEEADKLKSNFLGVVSNELRSPFVSLNMLLQVFNRLDQARLSGEQRTVLSDIMRSSDTAYQTVDRLVKYAGLLSKQGALHLDRVDLNALIDDLATTAGLQTTRKGINLGVVMEPNLVCPKADADLIREGVWQLLQNAIKATPSGGKITIRGKVNEGHIELQVEDTGAGIPKERQNLIWEPFVQGGEMLQRGVEGLGLGLALVRYIATVHQGQVFLSSEPGKGSVVGFSLAL